MTGRTPASEMPVDSREEGAEVSGRTADAVTLLEKEGSRAHRGRYGGPMRVSVSLCVIAMREKAHNKTGKVADEGGGQGDDPERGDLKS